MRDSLIYIAGPLFSEAEKEFNRKLKQRLSQLADIYLPQEDGKLLSEMVQNGIQVDTAKVLVFREDLIAIRRCDLFIIIMDGRVVDEGAAFELGYAYSKGKPCIGLRTDSRREIEGIDNPMIEEACNVILYSTEDLVMNVAEILSTKVSDKITSVMTI